MKYIRVMGTDELHPVVLLEQEGELLNLKELTVHKGDPMAARKCLGVAVDTRIEEFSKFFCEGLGNDNLSKSERAIIKTYLGWELGVGTEQEPEQDAEEARR